MECDVKQAIHSHPIQINSVHASIIIIFSPVDKEMPQCSEIQLQGSVFLLESYMYMYTHIIKTNSQVNKKKTHLLKSCYDSGDICPIRAEISTQK